MAELVEAVSLEAEQWSSELGRPVASCCCSYCYCLRGDGGDACRDDFCGVKLKGHHHVNAPRDLC